VQDSHPSLTIVAVAVVAVIVVVVVAAPVMHQLVVQATYRFHRLQKKYKHLLLVLVVPRQITPPPSEDNHLEIAAVAPVVEVLRAPQLTLTKPKPRLSLASLKAILATLLEDNFYWQPAIVVVVAAVVPLVEVRQVFFQAWNHLLPLQTPRLLVSLTEGSVVVVIEGVREAARFAVILLLGVVVVVGVVTVV
jgi:hypothetical protein